MLGHEKRIIRLESGVTAMVKEMGDLSKSLRAHMHKEEEDRKELVKQMSEDKKEIDKKINIAILILVAIAASQGVDLSGIL